MQIETRRSDDTLVVRLKGELDLHTASEFKGCVEREFSRSTRLKHLLLVLKDVPFVDSSGIGAILGRYKILQKQKGQLIVASLQPQVRKVFEFSGITSVIRIVEDEHDALQQVP